MLNNFFKLDEPFQTFVDLQQMQTHFSTSSMLQNVLFKPESIQGVSNQLFKGKSFKNVSFAKTKFENLTISDCDFEDCLFIGCDFVNCIITDCKFVNCNTHKITFDRVYIDPTNLKFDAGYRSSHSNIGVWTYHELYMNSKNMHQPEFSGEAEIFFRRWDRYQKNYRYRESKTNKDVNLCDRISHHFFLIKSHFFDLIMGYGHRPYRFSAISLLLLFALSLLVHFGWPLWGLENGARLIPEGDFLTSIYYTTVVITTLGFGDITPTTSWGRGLAIAVSLGGVIWLSLLAAVIIKRLIR